MVAKDPNLKEMFDRQSLELRASRERFHNIVTISTEGIVIVDGFGVILFVNPAAVAFFNAKAEKLRGEHFGFPIVAGETTELEIVNARGKGAIVEMRVVASEWEGKSAYLATLRDITERRRAEEAIRKAEQAAGILQQEKALAEAATRTKSQFLANMSHELRTPMTGVIGMLDLALAGNLEVEQREFISLAHTSAGSLVRILNDILDVTKIEMGKFSIELKPFSLRKCVEDTLSLLYPVAKSKGLDLDSVVDDNVPQILVGDQTRLCQILTNLAGNAVKFTEKGKVTLGVAAGGSTPCNKREITITVADTGVGVPDDRKHLLFHAFSQADESHSREYGGAGLGLAISKEIVERMGGTIAFQSEEGKGSTFSCTIPFGEGELGDEVPLASGTAVAAWIDSHSETTRKARLLVAEDDPIIRKLLGTMLQRSNYDVDFAENGLKAVEMWEKGKPDLILMDVQMPQLNGFEATGAVRVKESACGGHIPIVAMTAYALKEDQEKCFAAGMDAYISKPINFDECLQLIDETLKKYARATTSARLS